MVDFTKEHQNQMRRLAKEGQKIAKIFKDYKKLYPQAKYWDVYEVVRASGGGTSIGNKKMITSRLNKLSSSTDQEANALIIEEVGELVNELYKNYKASRDRLEKIREALGE